VDEGEEIEVDLCWTPVFLHVPYLSLIVSGDEVGRKDPAGQPLGGDPHGGHEVEAQERQVREVVLRERLALQMGVDAVQPLEPPFAAAVAAEVGDDDLLVVPDDGKADLPLAVDNNPDLASDFPGELGEVAGELRGDDLVGGDPAAVDPLQSLDLVRPQAVCIAVYLFNRYPLAKEPPPGDGTGSSFRCNR